MVTEEELQNMSPEEISELQRKNCIFCHIISGKVQAKKVYEDDDFVGILDINPANPGHILLLPKEHYTIMPQMPAELISKMTLVTRSLSHLTIQNLKASGTNIFIANGVAAGQKAQHFMIHIIPRKDNDGIAVFNLEGNQVDENEYFTLHNQFVKAVNEKFNLQQPIVEQTEVVPDAGEVPGANVVKPEVINQEQVPRSTETEGIKEKKKEDNEKKKEDDISLDDISALL